MGLEDIWRGTKNVLRSVPILGQTLGLSTPETIAAQRQQKALQQSIGLIDKGFEPVVGGYSGLEQYLDYMPTQSYTPEFSGDLEPFEYSLEADPNYQFMLEQGLKGVESSMAARGLTGSGREMKELARYSTGLAGQYAPQMRQQAFNEYQSGIQNRLSGLGLAGQLGQQRYDQEMGIANVGLQGLMGRLGAQSELARLKSGFAQQSGQIGASEAMANAAQIRNLMNQGAKAAAMMAGAPPGVTPQVNTQMQGYTPSPSELASQQMQGYRPGRGF